MFKKGDCVKIDAYATEYGSWRDVRGVIVSHDEWLDTARVLIFGMVSIIPCRHLEKIGATNETR
jgi:hypothetical protein|tara:strand:+ start:373 stop:564 length:192 start_codon:yes stop_codon:yes gene_type:complete